MGPAGAGKSIVAAQYATSAAARGHHAMIYLFDEQVGTSPVRADALGFPLRSHVNAGRITLQQVDAAQLSPGEFIQGVRRGVEQDDARVVVIDSLNGLLASMPEERSLIVQLHELLAYLNHRGVVSLMLMAQHGLIGSMSTPVDVTYLADTVVLCLAVVKGLVEQHGGRVSAHSAGLGQGSEFVVRLPLSAAAPPAPPTPARAPSRPRRIVVVEDHDDARDALQILLTLQGHEVRTASDGLTGVALILEVQPDVALIDVGLPGLDGYAVARRVRQGAKSPEIRLVAVTGYGQPYDRSRAREAGFDLHLTKPVSPEDIGEALSGS